MAQLSFGFRKGKPVTPLQKRFAQHVDVKGPVPKHRPELGPCWVWTASRDTDGMPYGRISVEGRIHHAHRVSWELMKGPIPAGLWVLHKCDNPPCVRPSHLFLGTRADNNNDMDRKGRRAKGERITIGKLTAEQVIEIRRLRAAGETQRAIAERFGVTRQTVADAVKRYWRHVA